MCLITYAPDKSYLNMEKMETAMIVNPDGFGIVFAKDDDLHYCWKMGKFELFKRLIEEKVPDGVPLGIHFRMTTHGDTNLSNVHPFPILTKKKNGRSLCMMHNGVISSIYDTGSKKSDTLLYVEKILKPILLESPDLIHNAGFKLLLERDIGGGNKFMFLSGDGRVEIINAGAGAWEEKDTKVWYSNRYSFNSTHRSSSKRGSSVAYGQGDFDWDARYGYGAHSYTPTGTGYSTTNNDTVQSSSEVIHLGTSHLDRKKAIAALPNDFTAEVGKLPTHLFSSLSTDEVLLRRTGTDWVGVKRYGWVLNITKGYIKQYQYLMDRHYTWAKEIIDKIFKEQEEAKKDTKDSSSTPGGNVVPITTPHKSLVEKAQDNADLADRMNRDIGLNEFRIMTEAQVMEWICDYPEECAKFLMKNGWFGSASQIEKGLNNDYTLLDIACDFIVRKSRGMSMTQDIEQHMLANEVPDDIAANVAM